MIKKFYIVCFLLFSCSLLRAQYNGYIFSISGSLNYTSSSKLFLTPSSSDVVRRNEFTPLEDILSYAFEARYRISEPLMVGLRVEYFEATETYSTVFLGAPIGVLQTKSTEGFTLIPIELSLYYELPFSLDAYKFYIGGGGGFYFGEHIREFLDVKSQNVHTKSDFGIQIAMGMEYIPIKFVTIRGEMRFRDPQYEISSKYSKSNFTFNGFNYRITSEEFNSKVNVDGVTFTVGISYQF